MTPPSGYTSDWRQQALNRGVDQNSPQYAQYRDYEDYSNKQKAAMDPVAQAQKIQQFNVQANQPAIATLKNQYNPDTGGGALTDKYNALLDSIKGMGSTSVNQQTLATSNELGNRGILPNSSLGMDTIAKANAPINAQYANLTSQTGLGEQQDLGNIINQIASLQAGNPESAITGATNILGIQQGATNLQAQLANALQVAQLQNQYREIPSYGGLYNTQTGQSVNQLSGYGGAGGIQVINGVPYANVP